VTLQQRGSKLRVDVGVRPAPEFIYLSHPEGRRPSAKLRALPTICALYSAIREDGAP
jgi:hypothetical protein